MGEDSAQSRGTEAFVCDAYGVVTHLHLCALLHHRFALQPLPQRKKFVKVAKGIQLYAPISHASVGNSLPAVLASLMSIRALLNPVTGFQGKYRMLGFSRSTSSRVTGWRLGLNLFTHICLKHLCLWIPKFLVVNKARCLFCQLAKAVTNFSVAQSRWKHNIILI